MNEIRNRKLKKIMDESQIYNLLMEFDSVFPHLHEKIDSYGEYAQKLSSYAYVCVYRVENENAGLLVYYANDLVQKTGYISLIGVKDKWKGKGIGKDLLFYAFKSAKENGMKCMKLEVDSDNEHAIEFYRRNGFVFCEDKNEMSMYMVKQL